MLKINEESISLVNQCESELKSIFEELDKKGYRLKEAAVNFVVYWERRKDKQEVKIVLPKIIVEKNTD